MITMKYNPNGGHDIYRDGVKIDNQGFQAKMDLNTLKTVYLWEGQWIPESEYKSNIISQYNR